MLLFVLVWGLGQVFSQPLPPVRYWTVCGALRSYYWIDYLPINQIL